MILFLIITIYIHDTKKIHIGHGIFAKEARDLAMRTMLQRCDGRNRIFVCEHNKMRRKMSIMKMLSI